MVETHAYPTGAFFVENPGWLSGGAVRWATRLLGLASDAELDQLAATAPPGADGVTFIPALAGAMTPVWRATARGTLHGLAAAHDRAHVARAVLEGLAFAARDVVDRLADARPTDRRDPRARRRRQQRGVESDPRRCACSARITSPRAAIPARSAPR